MCSETSLTRVWLCCVQGVDVWATGITLYMMAYGHCPFRAKTTVEMYNIIQTQEVEYPDTKFGPLEPELKQVIQMMLVKDAASRPTIDDIRVRSILSHAPRLCVLAHLVALPSTGAPVHC